MNAPPAMPRTSLASLLEARVLTLTDVLVVTHEVGIPLVAIERVAHRAYPLSLGDEAADHLLNELGRHLSAQAQKDGAEKALEALAAVAGDPTGDSLFNYLTAC
jgi:hypothetical protein